MTFHERRKKRNLYNTFAFICLAVMCTAGPLSANFDGAVEILLEVVAFVALFLSLLFFVVTASMTKEIKKAKQTYFCLQYGNKITGEILLESLRLMNLGYKKYLKGDFSGNELLDYICTNSPCDLYFKYRMKAIDINDVFNKIISLDRNLILNEETEELYAYSMFLYSDTFELICLYAKGFVKIDLEELVKTIVNYIETVDRSKLKELVSFGIQEFVSHLKGEVHES